MGRSVSSVKTSNLAPLSFFVCKVSTRATSSTMGPWPRLIKMAFSLTASNTLAFIMPHVLTLEECSQTCS